ncbi:diguanylate cyclase [Heliobacterium chlorum]|uniref:Diguanylate cyclase n=1 Tax=Heliobacterium chlorum TaxID=2698 RepID=A0ABR7T3V5_HELCL|nr:diguanylate cyclase [Heliobacterium chlorum]MBC9784703.1 diguanylate cyclase [Heliobacterium chlorum]
MNYLLFSKEELIKRLEQVEEERNFFKTLTHIYYRIIEKLNSGIVVHYPDSSIAFCNSQAASLLGLNKEEIRGKMISDPDWKFISPDGDPLEISEYPFSKVMAEKKPIQNMVAGIFQKSTNDIVWVLVNAYPFLMNNGDPSLIMITLVDITDYRKLMIKIQESESKTSNILNSTPVGICMTDEFGFFEDVNPAYCSIYGYSKEELIGKHFTVVCTESNKEVLSRTHDSFISGNGELAEEWEVVRKDGSRIYIYANATLIKDLDGRAKKVTFVIDVTDRKKFEQELKLKNRLLHTQAITDSLTGLLNHGAIFNSLDIEVIKAIKERRNLCLLLLDLDNFKLINDVYGHIAGDCVLMSLSEVLKSAIRKNDIVGRYGGEEFIVIYPDTELKEAITLSEKIRTKIQSMNLDYDLKVTASGGLAQLKSESSTELLKRTDDLLYKAKKEGKNRVVYQ